MVRCYKFSVVQVSANAPRNERLNIGIAVLADDRIDVRLPRTLSKVHAISHALEESAIRGAAENLETIYRLVVDHGASVENQLDALNELSPFGFSVPGEFFANSPEAYETEVDRLLRNLVEPEPAPLKTKLKKPSHLAVLLRRAFRKERILAPKGEGLSSHRIVTNLALAEGFAADFVLKNGAFHVIETVDASSNTLSPKKIVADVAVSALTIEQAKITFGEPATQGRLVYQASAETETAAHSALSAAEHQGIELINWNSEDDQRKLLATFASLAEPLPKKGKGVQAVHTSMQHRLTLN
jgi:hypothetical protein